ncbi:Tim44-like domain-containing protein [Solidesulfovibrio sp.]|uniref:Tim44 domain-containing protein n=1 Tax=Solidesulfovibrio sp. TaxID=2910990 RepID=UPI002B20A825|nr:Tim44-like domain-containing protein [Solidesulfovibrio sp.]MEA5088544.1 Tim44-like domain-containing protein [Solidesulfovibrio sp.]HML61612.1 Tim44-like domain-containing protein [Solidesulfovibrio sp.]
MRKATGLLMALFVLVFLSVGDVSAKRLGGGGSIGNRNSFSTTTRPSMGAPGTPSGAFGTQQQAQRQNPTAANPGGGMFSRPGFGGMLGGLLVGGLLGSMLFGGGHGWGGPSLLDILLIGGGLFLLMRFLRSRRAATQSSPTMARTYEAEPLRDASPLRDAAASGWGNLGAAPQEAPAGPQVPPGFDAEDFLAGAKTLFARLQRSWSARDIKDIEAFATPAFMEDVRKQAAEDPTPTATDVLLVDAQLLEVRQQGPATIASAYFDTLLREDPKASQPEQVREVWHFVRRDDVPGDRWKLDAIQQLEG